MSTVHDQVGITDGPLRFEFFAAMMRGNNQSVNFTLGSDFFGERTIAIYPNAVLREDGSGHSWIVNAITKPSSVRAIKRNVDLFYRTSTHKGFVSSEAKNIIPAAHGKPITIVNGPSLEDFFASLVDGDMKNRMSVQFVFNSLFSGSVKWNAIIDGVARRTDHSWRYYAMLRRPVDDPDFPFDLRVVGNYSTTDRTGQMYMEDLNLVNG